MTIQLSPKELHVVLWAVSQHTTGNGGYIAEIMREGLSRGDAKALLRADEKLRACYQSRRHSKRNISIET